MAFLVQFFFFVGNVTSLLFMYNINSNKIVCASSPYHYLKSEFKHVEYSSNDFVGGGTSSLMIKCPYDQRIA